MPVLYMDLDGTILDVWQRYYSLMRLFFEQQLSFPFPTLPEYRQRKLAVIQDDKLIQSLSQGRIRSESKVVRDYLKYKHEMLESEEMLSMDTVIGQIHSFAAQIKQQYKLHLLSVRRNQQRSIKQLQELGIAKYMDQVDFVLPSRYHNPKWDLIKSKVTRHDVIVGDSETDITCGTMLELRTFHVSTGLRNYEYVTQYGHAIRLNNYSDVLSHL